MRYARIWRYVDETPWAILPSKLDDVLSLLRARTSGAAATAEELEAFTGRQSPEASMQGAIAVLPVRGVIAHRAGSLDESSGGVSTESLAKTYARLMTDPNISAILLDVDSPGGAVAGVHELATQMLAMRGTKRVVAIANSTMASAAYWLAAAADEIVAIPSATVGSIGVASVHVDDSKQREQDGISVEVFTSGENKIEALGLGPLSEDARARRQARVNEAGNWFRGDVAKGRGVSVADVRAKYGEGMVFGAKDALAAGLIDRIATYDETLARMSGKRSSSGMRAEDDATSLSAHEDERQADDMDAAVLLKAVHDADRRRRMERF